MAKLLHPGRTVRVEPAGEAGKPPGRRVAYHLRVPGVYDRVALKRAVAARGAAQHGHLALLDAIEADLQAAGGAAEDLARATAAIAARRAALEEVDRAVAGGAYDLWDPAGVAAWYAALGETDKAGAEVLDDLAPQVARAGGRYARLLADNAVFWDLMGIEAARLLLVRAEGIAGLEAPAPARGLGGAELAEEALALIPSRHLAELGQRAQGLMGPTEAEAKNSASPSPTSSNAPVSTSAAPANGQDPDGPSPIPAASPDTGTSPSSD